MEPVHIKISKDISVSEVRNLMDKHNIEYLPVVDKNDQVAGFIERKMLNRFVATKIMGLQKHLDELG